MKRKLSSSPYYQSRYYQTWPPGPLTPKPTHTVSTGDVRAPFIHGKDRIPQRSTLYTAKVLAFTPQGFELWKCKSLGAIEARNATKSDSAELLTPGRSGFHMHLAHHNIRQVIHMEPSAFAARLVGRGPLCRYPRVCRERVVKWSRTSGVSEQDHTLPEEVSQSSTKFPFRLFERLAIGTSRRFYRAGP
jgi:hypothetical protein